MRFDLCGLAVGIPSNSFRGSVFDFRRCQIFLELVYLKRGPFNLVRIIEELLERKSSGFSLEN
jgi:hypothetical protein